MTKSKTKRSRILLIAAIVIVAGLGIWYTTRAKPAAKKTASTTTTTKTDTASTDEANKNDPTLDQKKASTTTTTSSKTITIMMSRPVNNDTVPLAEGIEVRSVISGTTTGTCSLTATGPGGKTVTKTASVTEQTSYGSCSFNIASSEVVAGQWQLALSVTSGDSTAKINTTVKVQ